MNSRLFAILCLLGTLVTCSSVFAKTRINVIVADGAAPLEQLAASEVAAQLERLFEADVQQAMKVPASGVAVLVGSPETNPAVKKVLGDTWPKISEQGIVVRSFADGKVKGVVVGGGSPAATLWAVYEMANHLGVRHLLQEDIYPDPKASPDLSGIAIQLEPTLATRGWRLLGDSPLGTQSWSAAEHRRLIGQLAKLKWNHVVLDIHPWQPFIDYELGGVKKETGVLWYGETFRTGGDTPGRKAFDGAEVFDNPDLAGKQEYAERTAAGIELVNHIIDAAHEHGMSVGLSIALLEFPREFAKVIPNAQPVSGSHGLSVALGGKLDPQDRELADLVSGKIRAYRKAYPKVDALYFRLSDVKQPNALAYLNGLLDDPNLLSKPGGSHLKVVIETADASMFPQLDEVLPNESAALIQVDSTARRIAQQQEALSAVPTGKLPCRLALPLVDGYTGIVSQSPLRQLETLVGRLRTSGWDGYEARATVLGELDPTVYYLSRASFDPQVTARAAHDDLFVTITGKQAVADRLWKGFGHIEAAGALIDRAGYGFTPAEPGMLMKHYRPEGLPSWWKEMIDEYTQTTIELYRSRGASHLRSKSLQFYWAKRSEYVGYFLAAIDAVRAAERARASGDQEEHLTQLETAVESVHNAMTTLADVAQNPSDRALIAVLAARAYRPLIAQYERALDAAE